MKRQEKPFICHSKILIFAFGLAIQDMERFSVKQLQSCALACRGHLIETTMFKTIIIMEDDTKAEALNLAQSQLARCNSDNTT